MSTSFPTSLDTTTNLPPIASTDTEDATGKEHDVQHTTLNGAVIALETKVGANSSTDPTSFDYRIAALEARPVSAGGSGTIYFA